MQLMHNRQCTWTILKGTVACDFPPPFFLTKVLTLDPDSYSKFFFQIWFKIRGVI